MNTMSEEGSLALGKAALVGCSTVMGIGSWTSTVSAEVTWSPETPKTSSTVSGSLVVNVVESISLASKVASLSAGTKTLKLIVILSPSCNRLPPPAAEKSIEMISIMFCVMSAGVDSAMSLSTIIFAFGRSSFSAWIAADPATSNAIEPGIVFAEGPVAEPVQHHDDGSF